MSLSDLFYFQPYLWLGFGGVFVLLAGLLPAGQKLAYLLTIVVLTGAMLSSLELIYYNEVIESFIRVNGYTQTCTAFFCFVALIIFFMSFSARTIKETIDEIYYSLIIFSTLGMALILSDNLIAVLIGIELVTICGFCLTAWRPERNGAIEAATKIVITAGVASAFLLMGIALIYIGSGTLIVSKIPHMLTQPHGHSYIVMIGFVMLLVGVGFEMAVVPFHNWLADFYEGAPVPVVTFTGTVGKLAVLAWMAQLPFWLNGSLCLLELFHSVVTIIAILSMIVGTVLALNQNSLKRIMAYSSVTHFGFILVALALNQSSDSTSAIIYYGLIYTTTTIAIFSLITAVESAEGWSDLEHYRGFGYRCPWAGIAMTIATLSLAGIPPFTGFIAKFLTFKTAIAQNAWVLVITMVLTSAASMFYYLRIPLLIFDTSEQILPEKDSLCVKAKGFSVNKVISYLFVSTIFIVAIMAQSVLYYITDKMN